MSRRIRKELAQELILFVKKVEISGNVHNVNSTNAFGKGYHYLLVYIYV